MKNDKRLQELETWMKEFLACCDDGYDLGQYNKRAHYKWPDLLGRLRKLIEPEKVRVRK